MREKTVTIRNLRATADDGRHRVTALVEDQEIWFESQELALRSSPEGIGSAMLVPALYRGARLRMEHPVCPGWRAGAHQATTLVSRWWQLPLLLPETTTLPAPIWNDSSETALCFTGGLDSFHSLFHGKYRPDWLVFVHGYDIELEDEVRLRAFIPSLNAVAAQRGARAAIIRTNLRQHPLLRGAPWIHTHGGALAAVGHLLGSQVSRLVIASSVPRSYDIPWGSHWQLDPLWSSGAVSITHDGDDLSREQKAWALAHEPLLKTHLRVCWENRTPTGNCSVCDKCVNAMLLLQQAGHLETCTAFQKPSSFVALLEALPETTFVRVYRAMCQRGLPPEVAVAVERLLQRTARQTFRKRVRRFFKRFRFRRA